MKIQLLSDLHLETHPHFIPTPAPGADVLVLAGDVGSYQQGSRLTPSVVAFTDKGERLVFKGGVRGRLDSK